MPDVTTIISTTCVLMAAVASWYFTGARTDALPESVHAPALLISSTFHSRFLPVLHSFRYPVLYICVDLDSIAYVDRIFSSRKQCWRILSLRGEDYLGIKYTGSLKEKLWKHLEDHDVDTTDLRRAILITTPRLLGYSFNPVSFHYVYDRQDHLSVVVLEVNNTFGEKHVYVLRQDAATEKVRKGYSSAQTFPRRFHVSPFNDRSGSYRLQCLDPLLGERLQVSMHLTLLAPDGTKKLTAQVDSTAAPIPTLHVVSSLWTLLRYGSAVFLTMPRILFQAYKIHYGKKLAVYLRPEPHEDIGAIGRSQASSSDSFFADLVYSHLKSNAEWLPCQRIIFTILPSSDRVVIEGSGYEDELHLTILSWSFFSSLVTSESALTCLWTDSLASASSALFRVSDEILFLRVFGAGFSRKLHGRWYLQDLRTKYRGQPEWFAEKVLHVNPLYEEFLKTTNLGIDNHAFDLAAKSKQSLWTYRYHVVTSLWSSWFGNALFGAVATFAGDAGRPADEWLRVQLELDRRIAQKSG